MALFLPHPSYHPHLLREEGELAVEQLDLREEGGVGGLQRRDVPLEPGHFGSEFKEKGEDGLVGSVHVIGIWSARRIRRERARNVLEGA